MAQILFTTITKFKNKMVEKVEGEHSMVVTQRNEVELIFHIINLKLKI